KAQVQVQNRVSVAEPKLPEEVRRLGITTAKRSPDITLVVNLVSPNGQYDKLYIDNYAYLQVKDALARLPGVGNVTIFGARDYSMDSKLNGQPNSSIGIFQLPGSNSIETSDAVHKTMEQLKQRFPPGLDYRIVFDTTGFTRESIRAVVHTLIEAMSLVVLV